MRCLVTGVAGFIGSHLAERLLSDGHEVVGVDAFTDYYPRSFKERNLANLTQERTSGRFRLVEGDLNDLPLNDLVAGQEWIFHQAGQPGVRASWGTSFDVYTSCNIAATQRLLEAVKGSSALKRLVYASSSSVYGDAPTLPVGEDALPRPVSPYGVTKLAAEHLTWLYWRNYSVPTVALRYFTVYGPRQRPDMAFHRFGKALIEGRELAVFGDGEQTRDFTYVSDAVEANVRAAATDGVAGMVFNIAGGSRVGLREAIATYARISGRELRVRFEERARGDVRDTFADTTRAQMLLGFKPTVGLEAGLAAELAYLESLYPPGGASGDGAS